MARGVNASQVVNIADLRLLAKRRLPRAAFDYIDGGADAEVTLRENCRVYEDVVLRPRSAVVTKGAELGTTVLGQEFALPFLLAPVGSCRMFYPKGEAVAARAAGKAGTGYVLSTLSGTRLEEVKQASGGIVTPPSGGETEHSFYVTEASGNRFPSANSSVSARFDVWYDLPSLRKEALITISLSFTDADGFSFSKAYDVRVAP